jgi:ACS family hexuronate transporter-like MFS transporter
LPKTRWLVLGLLFFAVTINYLDRLLLSTLSPVLRDEFGFSSALYGNISAAFQASYALGFLVLGRWLDRVGTKKGLLIAATAWSAASILHVTVTSAGQFAIWRALLGFSEGAIFPAAFKTLAEWFPPQERSLATGILNAGVNLASVAGPPLFVALTAHYGWRFCFFAVSSLGFLWILAWHTQYQSPQMTTVATRYSYRQLFQFRPTWGIVLAKILVDPTWYFLLFWLPLYFRDVHHLEMGQIGWALPFIYFMSGVGSLIGGWANGRLLRNGRPLGQTRLSGLLICACIVPVAAYSAMQAQALHSVLIFALAAAAHQAFSSISFMLPADVFPSGAVGTVLGLGGFAGAMSSVLFSAVLPGYLVPIFGYNPLVLALSFGYLVAVGVTWKCFGRFEPVTL